MGDVDTEKVQRQGVDASASISPHRSVLDLDADGPDAMPALEERTQRGECRNRRGIISTAGAASVVADQQLREIQS